MITRPLPFEGEYPRWVASFDGEPSVEDRLRIERLIARLSWRPRVLVVSIPQGEAGEADVLAPSLERQIYPDWSAMSIGRDAAMADIARVAAERAVDFVVLLDPAVALTPCALFEIANAAQDGERPHLVFGDEDRIVDGRRARPWFKPDFDPLHARGMDTLGVPAAFALEAFGVLFERSSRTTRLANLHYEMANLLPRTIEAARVRHVAAVLAHRVDAASREAWDAAAAAAFLAGLAEPGDRVLPCDQDRRFVRLARTLPSPAPSVTIIIPTRDQPKLVATVLDGLLRGTDYPSMAVVVVDNGTQDPEALRVLDAARRDRRVTVVRDDGPFNYSALNNRAAALAESDHILFLNNDIEVLHADWLTRAMAHFEGPDIGIVGPKLVYPDGRIQHAGVVFGPDDAIIQQFRLEPSDGTSPFPEVVLSRRVSAVTAACMAMPTALFREVGGFDEELIVGFNDIDLCRKVAEAGYSIVYAADSELVHHESVSRGQNAGLFIRSRERYEKHVFWGKHRALYTVPDPYQNANLVYGFFETSLAVPPRRRRPWADDATLQVAGLY